MRIALLEHTKLQITLRYLSREPKKVKIKTKCNIIYNKGVFFN